MIDFKEMDKVVKDLNNYVEKLQKTEETQKQLMETIKELGEIKNSITNSENSINLNTKNIEELEKTHEAIKLQFDSVLQDYKKLHSAFELIDIELKKSETINKDQLEQVKSLVEKTDRLLKDQEADTIIIQNLLEEKANQLLKNQEADTIIIQNLLEEKANQLLKNQEADTINTIRIQNLLEETKNKLDKITLSLNTIKNTQKENLNHIKIWFKVFLCVSVGTLIFSIIGLFI